MDKKQDYIEKLAKGWQDSGVNDGDILLVHSNIKRTLVNARRQGVALTPEDILDSFLMSIGSSGTLILPLFNFDFPVTKIFDIRNTPSQMGALTEVGRTRKDAVRTGHPIYSFAVLGKDKGLFQGIDNKSGYAEDSPFGMLHKLGGKIASLDLEDQNSMTFYHYVEEVHGVGYRYYETFHGAYVDEVGKQHDRAYKLFVRDIGRNVLTNVNPTGELMWDENLYKGFRPKEGTGLRTIKSSVMYDFVSKLITHGEAEGNLFIYGENK